jgi:hypothetical protein
MSEMRRLFQHKGGSGCLQVYDQSPEPLAGCWPAGAPQGAQYKRYSFPGSPGLRPGSFKNAHLLRSPAASPSWRRGKKSLLIRRDATLILAFGGVLHLPACRSPGEGRGIFEHPGEKSANRSHTVSC